MVTEAQIQRLKALIKSGADAELFFASIRSADWIPPLLEHGFFRSPPKPEASGAGQFHPPWPQSRYLARVAALAPEEAVKAALTIPATDNWTVNDNILAVALAVPPTPAARLAPRISEWLKKRVSIGDADDIAKLIVHLSRGPGFAAALKLFGTLIAFLPPSKKGKADKSEEDEWTPEPKSRFDEFNYNVLLTNAAPALAAVDAPLTLKVLAQCLDGFIRLKSKDKSQGAYDESVYWRPSIPEHEQNADHRLGSCLVSAIRDCAENSIRLGRVSVEQALSVLGKYRWDVFVRLRFHLARSFPAEVGQEFIRSLLLDAKYRIDGRWDLEYGLLLKEAYPSFSAADRAVILGWIEGGPAEKELEWMRTEFSGESAPPEKVERRINHWRLTKLVWIKDHLDPLWRARYDAWAVETGEPEHPGFHAWTSGGTVGSVSPLTLDEFRKRSLDEQIAYLRNWVPVPGVWNGPTRDGLAGVLQEEVKQDALRYLAAADRFIGLDPAYLAALFRAIAEGIKGKTAPGWTLLWDLAFWLVQAPDPEIDLPDDFTGKIRRARRWRPARLEIARFLDAALKGQTTILPFSDRERVWAIVEKLTADPDPGIEDESESKRGSFGPFTLSLNTVRGEAMNAVFSYVSWVHWHMMEVTKTPFSLSQVPEATRVLEARLDPATEPTLTIRSVYAVNINRLVFWDEPWLRAHLAAIFPETEPSELWDIAWTTFIKYSSPYPHVLSPLRKEFERAVRLVGNPVAGDHRDDPRASLGQHLMVAYWLGKIAFRGKGSLLATFFKHAPDEVRGRTLTFVGRSLKDTAGPIEPKIMARLHKLWLWRLKEARRAGGKDHGKEMAAFAWWLASKKLDEPWAVPQMVAALELTQSTHEQFLWMESFAALSSRFPAEAAKALELTLVAARDRGVPFWKEDEAEAILRAAGKSAQKDAMSAARRAQDILLKQGHTRFLHVLNDATPRP